MLSRIPTILLGVYIVNGVLANHTAKPKSSTREMTTSPSFQGPRQDSMSKEESIKKALQFTEFGYFKPRKFHLKPAKLKKKLGKHWDPAWMSVKKPRDFRHITTKQEDDYAELSQEWSESVDTSTLIQHLEKLGLGGRAYNDDVLGAIEYPSNKSRGGPGVQMGNGRDGAVRGVLTAVRKWMIEKATCPVRYVWEDLGQLFWPRFVRRGFCSVNNLPEQLRGRVRASSSPTSSGSNSECSWPPGMFCVPGKETRLKILRWKCRYARGRKQPGSRQAFPGTSWRQAMASNRRVGTRQGALSGILASEGSRRKVLPETKLSRNRHAQAFQSLIIGEAELDGKRPSDNPNLLSIMSNIQSTLEKNDDRKASKDTTGEETAQEDLSHLSWKELKKRFNVKCNWIKITHPVTNECHCTC